MGPIEESPNEIRLGNILFGAGLIAGLILRLYVARTAQTPGHGDTAFYYTVAENIVEGRGLVVDYVVYFLNGPEPITHYSGDFWNPLASVLISLPMLIFGKSVFNALLAPILFGLVPPVVGYMAGKFFSRSTLFAALSGLLTFFAPIEVRTSVATDSIIFFGAFGAGALYLAMRARQNPYYLLGAAVCTGLAQLTRQDGILLLIAIEAAILTMAMGAKRKLYFGAGVALIHLIVLSPLMIKNFSVFQAPFPPGPARTMFLTRYEDFHGYGLTLDWKSYRGQLGIRGILAGKLRIGLDNLRALRDFLDPSVTVLAVLGLANIFSARSFAQGLGGMLPALLFGVFEYLFYTLAASFSGPGSLPKCLSVLAPFISVLIVNLLYSYIRSKLLLAGIIAILAAYTGARGFQQAYLYNAYYNMIYGEYSSIKDIIAADAAHESLAADDIIIMTRNPWDVYAAMKFKAVMIPNNDIQTVYSVADIYGATYLILPAPRKSLQPIYSGAITDPRFALLATIPGSNYPDPEFKVFRIER